MTAKGSKRTVTPAEQLQVAALLLHLELQHLLQQLLPQRLLHQPHPPQLLPIQSQQRAACSQTTQPRDRSVLTCTLFLAGRTCDGVVGEGFHVAQVVVRAVLLQPFANVLLRPQHDGPDQAGLGGAGVIDAVAVTGAALHPPGREVERRQKQPVNGRLGEVQTS